MKKFVFYCIMFLVPLMIIEGAFWLLPTTYPPMMLPVNAQSPIPRFEPGVEFRYSKDWNFSIRTKKKSNNFGFINKFDYRTDIRSPLLMVIGDSFVQANQVDAGKSAAELLHMRVKEKGRVYSLGVSGAPLSQYLVMADYARETFEPDGYVFVIIANDFDESLIEYKSDPQFHYFDRTDDWSLKLVDYEQSIAKRVLRKSAFLRYLVLNINAKSRFQQLMARAADVDENDYVGNIDSRAGLERYNDATGAIDEFLRRVGDQVLLDRASILFVVDGTRPELYSDEDLKAAKNSYSAATLRYFSQRATELGFAVIDMQPRFVAQHREKGTFFDFPTDLHWNEPGNALVAEAISESALYESLFGTD